MAHLQFCADGQDITGDPYAEENATEVRAWEEDGTCLGAVTLTRAFTWSACASDVVSWTDYSEIEYRTWEPALAALLAVAGIAMPAR
jgi:hypothetical protein